MKKSSILSMVTIMSVLFLGACSYRQSDSFSTSEVTKLDKTGLSPKQSSKDSDSKSKVADGQKSDKAKDEAGVNMPKEVVGTWSGSSLQADSVEFTIGADGSFYSVSKYGSQTDYPRTEEATGYITKLVEDSSDVYRIEKFTGDGKAFLPGITGLGGWGKSPDTGFTIRDGQFVPIIFGEDGWHDFRVAYHKGALSTGDSKVSEAGSQQSTSVSLPLEVVGTWSGSSLQADSVEFTIGADGTISSVSEYNRHDKAVRVERTSATIGQLTQVNPGVYRIENYSGSAIALLPGITGLGGVGGSERSIGFDIRDGRYTPIVFEADGSWHGFGNASYSKGELSAEEKAARDESEANSPF
ncbi:hypothetical protein AB6M97_09500 [Streptococcus hillyeri]|uniref:Lipoprotein n=1 Tax=Streptococcus hillyeri TaxID=2282420 RepID=A0A3L9DUP6_9STRE|nr:hypothetical protein [Streptococcus hillyeri]RLY03633.1 hypothetical protein EAF07_04965 [Streptococcus hillyeri]